MTVPLLRDFIFLAAISSDLLCLSQLYALKPKYGYKAAHQ